MDENERTVSDEQAEHLNTDQEQFAGEPVDDEDVAPIEGPDGPGAAGFTPRPGEHVEDEAGSGWKPDEFPHGDPDPGPSLEEDPGARGPEARSRLPRNEPVPPEIGRGDQGDAGDVEHVDDESTPIGSEK